MIYYTFKEVMRENDLAQQAIKSIINYAERYIKAVIWETGSFEVTLKGKPAILALKGKRYGEEEHVAVYRSIDLKPSKIEDLSPDEVLALCVAVHELGLVQEEDGDTGEEAQS